VAGVTSVIVDKIELDEVIERVSKIVPSIKLFSAGTSTHQVNKL